MKDLGMPTAMPGMPPDKNCIPKMKVAMKPGWNNLNALPLLAIKPGAILRAAVGIDDYGQIIAPASSSATLYPAGMGAPVFEWAFLLTPPPPPPASAVTNF